MQNMFGSSLSRKFPLTVLKTFQYVVKMFAMCLVKLSTLPSVGMFRISQNGMGMFRMQNGTPVVITYDGL